MRLLARRRALGRYIPALAPIGYNAEVLADSPASYLKLSEAAGATTAVDASGGARTGTYNGSPTLGATGLIPGETETCMIGNGTNSWVRWDSAVSQIQGAFTIEFLCTAGTSEAKRTALGLHDSTGANKILLQAWDSAINATGWGLLIYGGGGSITGPAAMAGNIYHHVITVDAAHSLRWWVDGVLIGTSSIAARATTDLLSIGQDYDAGPTPSDFWNAKLEKVSAYPLVLSDARIAAHWNAASASLGIAIIDDFNRPDENPAVGFTSLSNGTLKVLANAATRTVTSGISFAAHTASGPFAEHQQAQFTVAAAGDGNWRLGLRITDPGAAYNGYHATLFSNGYLDIYRVAGGVGTRLVSVSGNPQLAIGDKLRFESGTLGVLKVFYTPAGGAERQLAWVIDDAPITLSGYAALGTGSGSADDFSGGSNTPAAPVLMAGEPALGTIYARANWEDGTVGDMAKVQAYVESTGESHLTVPSGGAAQGTRFGRYKVEELKLEPETGHERCESVRLKIPTAKRYITRAWIRIPAASQFVEDWVAVIQWKTTVEPPGSPPHVLYLMPPAISPAYDNFSLRAGDSSWIAWDSPQLVRDKWYRVVIDGYYHHDPAQGWVEMHFGDADGVTKQTLKNGLERYYASTAYELSDTHHFRFGMRRSAINTGITLVEMDDLSIEELPL